MIFIADACYWSEITVLFNYSDVVWETYNTKFESTMLLFICMKSMTTC